MVFERKTSINRDIQNIKKRLNKNYSLNKDDRFKKILDGMKLYYMMSKFDLTIYLKRLEYLKYKRNMQIGITSGFLASLLFIIFDWSITNFGPPFGEIISSMPSTFSKAIAYIVIFLLMIPLTITVYILMKTLYLYCFHVFFDGRSTYIDNYEAELLEEFLEKKYLITHRKRRRLVTVNQCSSNSIRKVTRSTSRY